MNNTLRGGAGCFCAFGLRWFFAVGAWLLLWPLSGRAELEIAASTSFVQPGGVGRLTNLTRAVPLRNGTTFFADLPGAGNKAAVVVNTGGRLRAFGAESFGATQPGPTSPLLALAADGDVPIVVARTGADNGRVGIFSLGSETTPTLLADITDIFRSVGGFGAMGPVAARDGMVAVSIFNLNTRPVPLPQPSTRLALLRDGTVTVLGSSAGSEGFAGFDGLTLEAGPTLYFSSVVKGVRNLYRWRDGSFSLLVPGGEVVGGTPLQIGSFTTASDGTLAITDTAGRRVLWWRDGQWSELARENNVAGDGTLFQMGTASRVLQVSDSDVYFTGARSYRYPSGSIVERTDLVFRVPRTGGQFATYFNPAQATLEGSRVSLTEISMGNPAELTITGWENPTTPSIGVQRAIWRGRAPFTATTFPAVPPGYPKMVLTLQTPDYPRPGRPLSLEVNVDSPGPVTYAWSHSETSIPSDSELYRGALTAQLTTWPHVQPYHNGTHTVAVTNGAGTSYAFADLAIDAFGYKDGVGQAFPLVNVSLKAFTGTGDNALMAGIALLPRLLSLGFANGQDFRNYETGVTRRVLIRAVGPGLAPFLGAASLPAATRLTLYRDGEVLATNDGHWSAVSGIADATTATGAFPLSGTARDSALLMDLPQQNYTTRVDAPDGDGTALIEFYAMGNKGNIRNISARGRVTENDPQTLTIGFVIAETPNGLPFRTILLRAVGPGLRALNVTGVSPAVQLQVFQGTTRLATNSDYRQAPNAADITNVSQMYGAFPLADGDAAVLLTLPAGAYTARVSAAPGSSGVALAELYTNVSF